MILDNIRGNFLNWYYGKKYPWFKGWYYCFPLGWFKAFGELMLDDIDEKLNYYDCTIKIHDIKEKYGELRFYFDCDYIPSIWDKEYDDEDIERLHRCYESIESIIEAYSHLSSNICVYCGKLDVALNDFSGYIMPLCKDCCKEADIDFGDLEEYCELPEYYTYTRYVPEYDNSVKVTVNLSSYIKRIRKGR